jgi:hypothetical protein
MISPEEQEAVSRMSPDERTAWVFEKLRAMPPRQSIRVARQLAGMLRQLMIAAGRLPPQTRCRHSRRSSPRE